MAKAFIFEVHNKPKDLSPLDTKLAVIKSQVFLGALSSHMYTIQWLALVGGWPGRW